MSGVERMSLLTYHTTHGGGLRWTRNACLCKMGSNIWTGSPVPFLISHSQMASYTQRWVFKLCWSFPSCFLLIHAAPKLLFAMDTIRLMRTQAAVGVDHRLCAGEEVSPMSLSLERAEERLTVLLLSVSWNGSCGWLSRFENSCLRKWTLSANKMLPARGSWEMRVLVQSLSLFLGMTLGQVLKP